MFTALLVLLGMFFLLFLLLKLHDLRDKFMVFFCIYLVFLYTPSIYRITNWHDKPRYFLIYREFESSNFREKLNALEKLYRLGCDHITEMHIT